MLDTYARKHVDIFINYFAKFFLKLKLRPNDITLISLLVGISAAILSYNNYIYLAVILLWLSGLFDAVDGAMARISKQTSMFGTLMDVTFDRIVEILIIISLSLNNIDSRFYMIILLSSIIISMTIFLTVGALSTNNSIKSFRYQAGFAERSEGFIFLSLMMIFNNYLNIITILFAVAVLFTASQRFFEAKKIFNEYEKK